MNEKRKGHPRRRLLSLFILLLLSLGGYFSLPLVQTTFVAWWEDDPFTPMCNVPNLRLRMNLELGEGETGEEGFPFYDVASRRSFAVAEGLQRGVGTVSPNGRWIINSSSDEYDPRNFLYEIETNTQIEIFYTSYSPRWLPDSRLLIAYPTDENEIEMFIYNPENQSEVEFPYIQVIMPDYPLINEGYFLGVERIEGQGLELSVYGQNLERELLQHIPTEESWYWQPFSTVSPHGRYLAYSNHVDNPEYHGIWIIDLSEDPAEPVRVSSVASASGWLEWSPDSASLLYKTHVGFEYENGIQIYDTATESHILGYEIPNQYIIGFEWTENGIWMWTENQLEENPGYNMHPADALYWGDFDGLSLNTELVMEASMGTPVRPLRDSDMLIVLPLESPKSQFLYEAEWPIYRWAWNRFILVNPEGEILQQVENIAWDFMQQTPDNRYMSYQRKNGWIYLLDLQTYQSCKVLEAQHEYEAYEWLTIPQP